jgi:Deltex C-terminal domain
MELQAQFNSEEVTQKHQVQVRKEVEELFQNKTYTEKAFTLTSEIVVHHETIQMENASEKELLSHLSLVNADDVLFFTERLFQYLDEMPSEHLRVEVGYVRYSPPPNECPNDEVTTPMNAVQISVTNDGPFGSGIYVANHPFCFGNSNDVFSSKKDKILMIARLNPWTNNGDHMGTEKQAEQQQPLQGVFLGSSQTHAFQISVLGRSAQCVPLVLLDKQLLRRDEDHYPGNELVFRYHVTIQNCLDKYFNVKKPKTPFVKVLPSQVSKKQRSLSPPIPLSPDAEGITPTENFYTHDEDMGFALAVAMDEKEITDSTTAGSSEPRSFLAGRPANAATVTGRAFSFTTMVVENHDRFLEDCYGQEPTQGLCRWFSLVNADDILFFSERLLQYWNDAGDINSHIDIGYARYRMHGEDEDEPQGDALPHIQTRDIVTRNGPFGDGIYLANHPFVSSSKDDRRKTRRKGDKILMVARVRSINDDSSHSGILLSGFQFSRVEHDADVFEISVIGKSSQCIPLLLFDSRLVDSRDFVKQGHVVVYRYHCLLQAILDEYFNVGRPKTVVTKRVPSILHDASSPTRSLRSYDPKLQCIVSYTAPENSIIPLPDNDRCPLPLDLLLAPLSSLIAPLFIDTTFQRRHRLRNPLDGRRLNSSLNYVSIVPSRQKSAGLSGTKITLAYECGATFDITFNGNEADDASCESIWASIFRSPDFLRQLQHRAFLHSQKCNSCINRSCTNDETINIGVMPTGAMQVFEVPEATCPGFEPGVFLISYKIESGVQKNYHENPGVRHPGTSREAFVPSNVKGRALIQRLIYAFAHGMTFRVGVSVSTGKPNSVTWASIPHKTSLTYGPFGYPDPNYFDEVNEQLNILGVPSVFPVFSIDR